MKHAPVCLLILIISFDITGETDLTYSRSTADGSVIANSQRWYYEELDSMKRPINGVLWEGGKIVGRTSWLYYGVSQQAMVKIQTHPKGTSETSYDESGNITRISETDLSGVTVKTVDNTYNSKNLLTESIVTQNGEGRRTVYEYSNADKISKKELFINGALAIRYMYETEENWTETIYRNNVPVLVENYIAGTRVKGMNGQPDDKTQSVKSTGNNEE